MLELRVAQVPRGDTHADGLRHIGRGGVRSVAERGVHRVALPFCLELQHQPPPAGDGKAQAARRLAEQRNCAYLQSMKRRRDQPICRLPGSNHGHPRRAGCRTPGPGIVVCVRCLQFLRYVYVLAILAWCAVLYGYDAGRQARRGSLRRCAHDAPRGPCAGLAACRSCGRGRSAGPTAWKRAAPAIAPACGSG